MTAPIEDGGWATLRRRWHREAKGERRESCFKRFGISYELLVASQPFGLLR